MGALEIIMIIIFVGGSVALLVVNTIKWNKQQEAKKDGLIKYSAIYTGQLKHIDGLPIASGSIIDFFYGKQKITFKKDNQEISLECNKITSMDIVLGKNIKSQAGTGAIAGNLLLGGIGGAAIGAMLATTFYLVIIYNKENENRTILLDSTGSNLPFKKILDNFKNNNLKETKNIEL